MIVCDVHALNDVFFIFSDCRGAAVSRSLVEVPHMRASPMVCQIALAKSWVLASG